MLHKQGIPVDSRDYKHEDAMQELEEFLKTRNFVLYVSFTIKMRKIGEERFGCRGEENLADQRVQEISRRHLGRRLRLIRCMCEEYGDDQSNFHERKNMHVKERTAIRKVRDGRYLFLGKHRKQ